LAIPQPYKQLAYVDGIIAPKLYIVKGFLKKNKNFYFWDK